MLGILSCIPNIRPADELNELLLWLLGTLDYDSVKDQLDMVLVGFQGYSAIIYEDLKEILITDNDRSSLSEREVRKHHILVVNRIRRWYSERTIQITVIKPLTPAELAWRAATAPTGGNPDRSVATKSGGSKSQPLTTAVPVRPDSSASSKRPKSSGIGRPARPVTIVPAKMNPTAVESSANASNSNTPGAGADPNAPTPTITTLTVLRHEGMSLYLDSARWQRQRPTLAEQCGLYIQKQSAGVPSAAPIIIEDTFDEFYADSIRPAPVVQQSYPSQQMNSFGFQFTSPQVAANRPRTMQERLGQLYDMSNDVSMQQKHMFLAALLSDLAHSIMVNIIKLE
jgi:hypothetical protein